MSYWIFKCQTFGLKKKLVFSKYTRGKASQAWALLKTVDSGTEFFVEKLKFTTPDTQQLHQGLLPPQQYQHRPGKNWYNLAQKNTALTFFLLLGTKNTEISHGFEKTENISIQVPRTILNLRSDRADRKGQSGIFVIIVFWVYRSFHFEVFRKDLQTFKNVSISFYTKTQSQLKILSNYLLMDMYLISWNEAILILLRAFSSMFLTLISGRRSFGESISPLECIIYIDYSKKTNRAVTLGTIFFIWLNNSWSFQSTWLIVFISLWS